MEGGSGGPGWREERWLFASADVLTILAIFFLLVCAHSAVGWEGLDRLEVSFREAFAAGRLVGQPAGDRAPELAGPAGAAGFSSIGPLPGPGWPVVSWLGTRPAGRFAPSAGYAPTSLTWWWG